ncbi:hypothetical protein [Paenibacillus sp. LjRoot56]|uniref:hypothetical protein n=1 Tax=Paenibacillus sp. LjRoot56 TaxID=3342333 RepID=UPI003ECC3A8D
MPDSIIISPVSSNTDNLMLLANLFYKTIVLDLVFDSIDTNYVKVNHMRAGYLSAIATLNKNHSQNLVLAGPVDFPVSNQIYRRR